jgi:hypothetical protein
MKKARINKPSLYIINNGKIFKKKCPCCGLYLFPKDFFKNSQRGNGLSIYCKKCRHKKYIDEQDSQCEKAGFHRRKLRWQAYNIIANGKKIKCQYHDLWNCCGDPYNGLYLSLDHIKGDGFKQKKELNTSSSISLYRWIIKNPKEARKRIQILCMNAQFQKRRCFNEVGGKRRGTK